MNLHHTPQTRIRRQPASLARLALVAGMICSVGLVSLTAVASLSAEERQPVLNVSGTGSVVLPVSYAKITLSVSAVDRSAAAAQANTAKRADKLVTMLKKERVNKLQTESISLHTQYRQPKNGARITEYRSVNTLSFRVPVARAGALLDKSIAAGADLIQSVELRPADEAAEEARKQAMAAAAVDARDKADVVLSALGLRAKQIVQIDVNYQANNPVPLRQMTRVQESLTPVVGGEASIRATVRIAVSY